MLVALLTATRTDSKIWGDIAKATNLMAYDANSNTLSPVQTGDGLTSDSSDVAEAITDHFKDNVEKIFEERETEPRSFAEIKQAVTGTLNELISSKVYESPVIVKDGAKLITKLNKAQVEFNKLVTDMNDIKAPAANTSDIPAVVGKVNKAVTNSVSAFTKVLREQAKVMDKGRVRVKQDINTLILVTEA